MSVVEEYLREAEEELERLFHEKPKDFKAIYQLIHRIVVYKCIVRGKKQISDYIDGRSSMHVTSIDIEAYGSQIKKELVEKYCKTKI